VFVTGGEALTAGKALLFFALPLGFAVWELIRTRRELRRQRRSGAGDS
jgi:hypothetical protein